MDQKKLALYAIKAGYFIVENIPEWIDKIDAVILFGSIAQGRGDKDSDIDLFFDAKTSEKQKKILHSRIRKAISEFCLSQDALKFKMAGISNQISFFIGRLEEWKDLQRSISSTGIILYGKYSRPVKREGLNHYLLISWGKSGVNRGAFLNKLYGYTIKGRKYKGLIYKSNAIKIGKSSIMIPVNQKDKFFKSFEDYRIKYNIIEVFSDLRKPL